MINSTASRAWWHAVGPQLERGVRHRAAQAEEAGACDATEPAWLLVKGKSGATRSAQETEHCASGVSS